RSKSNTMAVPTDVPNSYEFIIVYKQRNHKSVAKHRAAKASVVYLFLTSARGANLQIVQSPSQCSAKQIRAHLNPVGGEFLLTRPSVFDRAHDNVFANGTIEDSGPSIQLFRLALSPSAPNDCNARCSSL